MTPLSPALLLAALNALAAQRSNAITVARLPRTLGPKALRRLAPGLDDGSGVACNVRAQLDLIHLLGWWAHYDHEYRLSSWPVPHVGSPELLEEFAGVNGVLVKEPNAGDIYIAAGRNQRPSQVGIVTTVQLAAPIPGLPAAATCHTARGVRSGGVAENLGPISIVFGERCLTTLRGDRFIRWADLDWRHILAKRVAA